MHVRLSKFTSGSRPSSSCPGILSPLKMIESNATEKVDRKHFPRRSDGEESFILSCLQCSFYIKP